MITANLHLLVDQGVQFVRLGAKAGTYQSRRTKQGATHRLLAIPGSVLVEPLRKPRKNRRLPAPFQRYSEFNNDTMSDHFQIPAGATHVCYTTSTGRVEIIAQVSAASDFKDMRGTLRYGIYHAASDRFQSLMPQDKNDPYLTDRDPTPCRCPINEHRTMKEVERPVATAQAIPPAPKAPRAPKAPSAAPAAPRAPRAPAVPGAAPARPAAGSKTAAVWDAADALAKELGREPAKAELVAKLPGHNPSTISVQFSAWRKARHQAS